MPISPPPRGSDGPRHDAATVSITVEERTKVSPLSLALGYGAMLPIVVGTAGAAFLPLPHAALAERLTLLWGAAILLFLSGVRRGLSFRTPGGPRIAQLAAMLWIFLLGLGAVLVQALAPAWFYTTAGLAGLGYASLLVLDPIAARQGEVPPFFARLRPFQMLIPVVCLAVLAFVHPRNAPEKPIPNLYSADGTSASASISTR